MVMVLTVAMVVMVVVMVMVMVLTVAMVVMGMVMVVVMFLAKVVECLTAALQLAFFVMVVREVRVILAMVGGVMVMVMVMVMVVTVAMVMMVVTVAASVWEAQHQILLSLQKHGIKCLWAPRDHFHLNCISCIWIMINPNLQCARFALNRHLCSNRILEST